MQYSLSSRFQGCFEGMVAADQWNLWSNQQPAAISVQVSPWIDLAIQAAEALIQETDWPLQSTALDSSRLSASSFTSGKFAIATLPVALFFHDDLILQQQHLRQTVQTWGGTSSMADWVAVFGYAIAQAMKAQLAPSQFMADLLSYWNGADPDLQHRSPQLLPSLELLHGLVDQGAASRTTIAKLEQLLPQEDQAIALAFYCFLCTPDNWQLAVRHAARLFPAHPVICALTGCLSGAYNSHSSLPLAWKLAALQPLTSFPSSQTTHITCTDLATRLLATWSGIFDASHPLAAHTLPVTSPRIPYPRLP